MIHSYKYCKEKVGDEGVVSEFKGSLATVVGFKGGFVGEGVVFEDDRRGIVLTIKNEKTIVSLFSRDAIQPGIMAVRTGNFLSISVGEGMLGNIVSSLGYNLDGDKDPSKDSQSCEIDVVAPNLSKRRKITKFLHTGVSVCDLVTPLGQGQRELVVGDRKTGKSHFLYQLAMSQARAGKVVVYAFIGKKSAEINRAINFFKKNKVMENCILVVSSASSSPGEIFVTPFSAMTIAEYFRDKGKDCVVILDDLTTHAKYYRETSLLAGKFPGRESYPGDIFYTHAKMLERAGNFDVNGKEVSISAFPVAETYGGDFAGYIQTNLASITDGHLYFDDDLFLKGVRPAINIFLSVTRVGRQTQGDLMRDAGSSILATLKKHSEMQKYMKFGTEITPEVRSIIETGNKLFSFYNQVGYGVRPVEYSLIYSALIIAGKTGTMTPEKIKEIVTALTPSLSKLTKFDQLIDEVKKYGKAPVNKQ